MKTYIFYVNRMTSRIDMQRYNNLLDYAKEDLEVQEYMKDGQYVEVGDRAYFVMLHYWDKGVCASGTITDISHEDGRYAVMIKINMMINPEKEPLLPLKDIQTAIPNFDWEKAADGTLLLKMYANKLEGMWNLHVIDNNIGEDYIVETLTPKARKMSDEAEAAFEEYSDGGCDADALYNYDCFLEACSDELLDQLEVSYKADPIFFDKEECHEDEKPYMYDDPTIILTPKQEMPFGQLSITCRGFEFSDGHMIRCDVNTNNEKEGRECVDYLKQLMKVPVGK